MRGRAATALLGGCDRPSSFRCDLAPDTVRGMQRLGPFGIVVVALAVFGAACSDSGRTDNVEQTSLADALTNGVKFENGVFRRGDIGDPGSEADSVKVASTLKAMSMKPGGAALMSFGVENPDEDSNGAVATLMQFEGSAGHIEVPIDDNAREADGGASGTSSLQVENPWTCEKKICEHLCNRRLFSRLTFAVTLEDGSISEHHVRDVVLDCTKDGDPKACKSGDGEAGEQGGAGSAADAGALDAANAGGDASAGGDAGGAASGDAGSGSAPQIGLVAPANAVAGMAVMLSISGTGFADGAVVVADGQPLTTTFVSDGALTATVPSARTMDPGSLAIFVENVPGDERTRSNTLYLQVDPVEGAPLIYDYSPDNGVVGDKILIIAKNLAGETPQIYDSQGTKLSAGTLSTISWPNAGTVDTIEVELPKGIATGPLVVSNSLGSFKGKIFSVGRNLTRIDGTELSSSTDYNTSNWSHLSGGDNKLETSFFTKGFDCATDPSCTSKPWFLITFPSAQTVARIAFRGNREYASGYDFLSAKFEVLAADDEVLWEGAYDLPAPDRDLDLVLPTPVGDAVAVRFSSLADESIEPGFAELEVFGP